MHAAIPWASSAIHFGGINAEQHTQQEAEERAPRQLLDAWQSPPSCIALDLWGS